MAGAGWLQTHPRRMGVATCVMAVPSAPSVAISAPPRRQESLVAHSRSARGNIAAWITPSRRTATDPDPRVQNAPAGT